MPHPIGSMHTHRNRIPSQITVVRRARGNNLYEVLSFYHHELFRPPVLDQRTFNGRHMIPIVDEEEPHA